MTPEIAPNMVTLLADARWVRALARTLAVDAEDADDLAQEAYLQALRRPPDHGENLRGWFQRVLQNLVRQHRRATRRRQGREQSAVDRCTGAATPTADLVARAATHRAVVDAVLRLDEPYRATILLRFFEDLPPREIAARMTVPVATVHTRLQRGCARLRRYLDTTGKDRRAWGAALLPLPPVAAPLTFLELMTMHGKALALGATLVVGATLWLGSNWLAAPTAARDSAASGSALTAAPNPETPPTGAVRTAVTPARTVVPSAAEPVAIRATPTQRLDGRVVDGEGQPVAEIAVVLRSGTTDEALPRARTDRVGAFTLVADGKSEGRVKTDEREWLTVMHASVQAGEPPRLALVVAAPKVALAGHVRSADGRALAAAQVQVVWPADLRARLSDISDAASEEVLLARTAADGAFALDAARVRGAFLMTTAEGYLPDRRPVPAIADRTLAITLTAPQAKPGMLQGQVVDPRGTPVAGARVALGSALERSNAEGHFLIADDGESPLLSAALAGYRRAAMTRPSAGFTTFVTLALVAAPLTIRGRVVDENGVGVPQIKVWTIDPTLFSDSGECFAVEGISAGHTTMGDLRDKFRRGELTDPERTLRDTPTTAWPWARTDADGTFALTGLEERAYRLRVMDDRTVLMIDTDPIAAGRTDIVVRIPRDALFATVRGQVVAHNGEPVAGARLHVQVDTQRLGGSTMHGRALAATTSDATGKFELPDVPKEHAYLRLEGEGILPLEYGRGAAGGLLALTGGDVVNLRIEVRVRLHVQIELRDPTSADALAVHDLAGQPVTINVFSGRGRRESDTLSFADGKTPVFVVPDTASALIFYKDDKEVRREVLQLRPGDVNALRL